jgi:hypothetical protein
VIGADAEAFALDLNLAAAEEAARQICAARHRAGWLASRLRRMQAAKSQRAVAERFPAGAGGRLGRDQ